VSPAIYVALAGLILTLLVNGAGWMLLLGKKDGALTALTARVSSLESEVKAIGKLELQVAKIGERQDMWIEQLKDLNASIRWMRDPAEPTKASR